MKKILTLLMILLISFSLASCNKENINENGHFTFELVDLNNDKLINKKIKYDNISILSSIEEVINLDITKYDIGSFINGVNNNYPKEYNITYNYFYNLYVNNEMFSKGIDFVNYEKNLLVTIKEETTLSETDLLVDNIIETLIKDIDISETIDYLLFASLVHLNKYGYNYIDLKQYQYNLEFDTISNSLKSLVYNQILNKEISDNNIAEILNLKVNGQWDYPNYLNTLNILGNQEELMTNIALRLIDEELYLDADSISMLIISLSSLNEKDRINEFINDLVRELEDEVGLDGIKGFGGENLASTAQSLIALISIGESSNSLAGIDLVTSILKYYSDGGFKYQLDGEIDLMFSTPQGLASLIIYKIQRDQLSYSDNKSLNIFGFNYEN